ncbi:hypothetical protein SDC9_175448 [bioreactor metagenome]|uniref:Uncharacterized protein n=1 Tax=bioreactor metagenome TaxID=1076179 RepID=A0A645GVF6_9ZZZZ
MPLFHLAIQGFQHLKRRNPGRVFRQQKTAGGTAHTFQYPFLPQPVHHPDGVVVRDSQPGCDFTCAQRRALLHRN